jgi:hypothetical protein
VKAKISKPKRKVSKSKRIRAMLAEGKTRATIVKSLKVSPQLVYAVAKQVKQNSDFVSKVFAKIGKERTRAVLQPKIHKSLNGKVKWVEPTPKEMRSIETVKSAMDALEKKPKRKRRITRRQLLKELKPGLNALFGTEYKKFEAPVPDPVNHPPHYKAGGIETIDFIEAKDLNYRLGNVVKYISRAGKKIGSDPIKDLEKAMWYLQREINVRKRA